MFFQNVSNLFNYFPGNATAAIGDIVPLAGPVTSAAMGALSNLPYLQIGGAGLLIGASYLSYRCLDESDVQTRALPLMQGNMDRLDKAQVFNAIRKIPFGERKEVIERAWPLLQGNIEGWEKAMILKAIQESSSEEREDIVQQALLLIQDDMNGWDKDHILNVIRKIPLEERGDVMQRALSLMQGDMKGWEKAYLLDAIQLILPEEREDVMQQAWPSMQGDVAGRDKAFILNVIRMLPIAERNPRAARAFEQLQIDFPNGRFDNVDVYVNRVRELLETPLDQVFFPMGQDNVMAAAAEAGHAEINVHAGDRDVQVKAALLLLRKSHNMTDQEIDLAANKCIQYLEVNGLYRALEVLKGPENSDDFGPFFKDFIINSTPTSGQEVIGRLWGFIHALPDLEKQLLLGSFVAELDNCINEHGERICDQGKMQHLFIAVLQGRLAGVQVDDSIEIPKVNQEKSSLSQGVPVQVAIRVFFATPKNQGIDRLEFLLIAAHEFCDENPRVEREAFIQELKNYAAASGIQ